MSAERLDQINQRLQRVSKSPVWWSPAPSGSRLLQDLHGEFAIHYLVLLQTLFVAHGRLTAWRVAAAADQERRGRLLDLGAGSIENALDALEADKLDRLMALTASIAESASQLLGLRVVLAAFDVSSALQKVESILAARRSEVSGLDELLPRLEGAMERMLFAALWVDSQVSAIVGHSDVSARSVETLKAPIVARLAEQRTSLSLSGVSREYFRLPDEGLWPVGLRSA